MNPDIAYTILFTLLAVAAFMVAFRRVQRATVIEHVPREQEGFDAEPLEHADGAIIDTPDGPRLRIMWRTRSGCVRTTFTAAAATYWSNQFLLAAGKLERSTGLSFSPPMTLADQDAAKQADLLGNPEP